MVKVEKQTKVVLDSKLLKITYNSTHSPELQCQVALSGSQSVSTVCGIRSIQEAYDGLKSFLQEIDNKQ